MLIVFLLIRKPVMTWLGSSDYVLSSGKATLSGFFLRLLALYIDYNILYLPSQFLLAVLPLSEVAQRFLIGAFLIGFILFKIGMEHYLGFTPGKRLVGLSVKEQTDSVPSLFSSFTRNSLLVLLIIFQFMIINLIDLSILAPIMANTILDGWPSLVAVISGFFLIILIVDSLWYFRHGKRKMYHDVIAKT